MTHANNMTVWPKIACQRGHQGHESKLIQVSLGGQTPYHDYAPIPEDLARSFSINVFDWAAYAEDGPYCPAHDAVSETIGLLGVWEPPETTLALWACRGEAAGIVVDVGAQIGWYTMLAATCGRKVLAIDADAACLRLLRASAKENGFGGQVKTKHLRVGPDSAIKTMGPVRLVKIDVEGAENDAIKALWDGFEEHRIDHLLMEVSPVFDDYYPALVLQLIDVGYRAYRLPPKRTPPYPLSSPADLEPFRLDRLETSEIVEQIEGCVQEDMWFTREEAAF